MAELSCFQVSPGADMVQVRRLHETFEPGDMCTTYTAIPSSRPVPTIERCYNARCSILGVPAIAVFFFPGKGFGMIPGPKSTALLRRDAHDSNSA